MHPCVAPIGATPRPFWPRAGCTIKVDDEKKRQSYDDDCEYQPWPEPGYVFFVSFCYLSLWGRKGDDNYLLSWDLTETNKHNKTLLKLQEIKKQSQCVCAL